jgi:hypothetical protein
MLQYNSISFTPMFMRMNRQKHEKYPRTKNNLTSATKIGFHLWETCIHPVAKIDVSYKSFHRELATCTVYVVQTNSNTLTCTQNTRRY